MAIRTTVEKGLAAGLTDGMIRSAEKIIHIHKDSLGFDFACQNAYQQALWKFGIDDCGHSEPQDGVDFPRSASALVVEFVGFKHSGGMGGQSMIYTFKAYLEMEEDDES